MKKSSFSYSLPIAVTCLAFTPAIIAQKGTVDESFTGVKLQVSTGSGKAKVMK